MPAGSVLRPSRARRHRGVAIGLVAALLAVLMVPIDVVGLAVRGSDGATPTAEAATTHRLTITLNQDDWSSSGTQTLSSKGDVIWRNRSGRTLSITSPTGVLDSGPIPDGGSFVASLPVPGAYAWESEVGGGSVTVATELSGGNTARALDGIPDVPPPARDADDVALHPDLAVRAPRSTAIVGFAPDATVAQANSALGFSWEIVGGLPNVGLVYVQHSEPQASFAAIDSALSSWRANAAIEFAALDLITFDAVVPEPSDDRAALRWYWDSPAVSPNGQGANWGQEVSRLPAAWNLLETARDRGAEGRSATVVLDSGFEEHADLSRLQRLQLCTDDDGGLDVGDGKCTSLEAADHGNHVAGIIGADHDGIGVNGADPLSSLYGLAWHFEETAGPVRLNGLDARIPVALSLLLSAIRDGRVSDVSVVNLSVQLGAPSPKDWWAAHGDDLCGPGADDDATGTDVCHPSNHDRLIEENVAYGQVTRRVIEHFVRLLPDPPLFVNSTGNLSNDYCADRKEVPKDSLLCTDGSEPLVQKGEYLSAETWANKNWRGSVGQNPVLSVEALGSSEMSTSGFQRVLANRERAQYSNTGGNVSAPGWAISTQTSAVPEQEWWDALVELVIGSDPATGCAAQTGPDTHCLQQGTSQAAPLVAGIAGLIASWDPTLSAAQVKQLITDWSVKDTSGGAAPRVDSYAPLLAQSGAVDGLVDVNDPSNDGNRRVRYAADGSVVGVDTTLSSRAGRTTEADGTIDMRDFRRFRDAWLLRCTIVPEPGCPIQVDLDGDDTHPKFDLNLDGGINRTTPNERERFPSELTFPRFDFNGDGALSVNDKARVSLDSDGNPVASPGDADSMTDLDVLVSQWDGGGVGDVPAGELAGLLRSADLTLVADGLSAIGATSADVAIVAHDSGDDIYRFSLGVGPGPYTDYPVFTVPAGDPVRVEVEATGSTEACSVTIGPVALIAGEDRRLDLDRALSVLVEPSALRPDGTATATVSASSCGQDVSGTSVSLGLSPVNADGARLDGGATSSTLTLGADGTASATISAGTVRDVYGLSASADLVTPSGGLAALTTTTSFSVGEAYELEVAAVDGAESGYAAVDEFTDPGVPLGPSVNGSGDVAFGGLPADGDRYHLYVTQPGDDPLTVADADDRSGTAVPASARITGEPQLTDSGVVAYTSVEPGDNSATFRIHRSGDSTEELAVGVSSLSSSARFVEVGRPTVNDSGRTLFRATRQDGTDVLAERQGSLVVEGIEAPFVRPRLADDDTSVVQATVARECADYPGVCPPNQSQLFDSIILAGDGLQAAGSQVLAEGRIDGWGALSDPDISGPGDVIAHVGDKDGQRGLWLAVRSPSGSFQAPIAIAGPAAEDPDLPELDLDRPTVVQIPRAPAGPAGDRVLVAFRGTGTGAVTPAANAVYTVGVDLLATADTAIPIYPRVDDPQVVAAVGESVDGFALASLELGDSLAAATSGDFPDDHWVAFFARTADGRSMYVRAGALPPPTAAAVAASEPGAGPLRADALIARIADGALALTRSIGASVAAVFAAPTAAMTGAATSPAATFIRPATGDPADLEILPGEHVAAVTVHNDSPAERESLTLVNRSRAMDGTPSWAVLDEDDSTPETLDNPMLLAPDEVVQVVPGQRGTEYLEIGAPLVAGDLANDALVQLSVTAGTNRPPVADIKDSPFVIAPGQRLTMAGQASDPDGNIDTYAWDLDDDGDFDDWTSISMNLTVEQVQSLLCSGSCTLDTAYPVAFRVVDADGAQAVARSTVTYSGLSGMVLRLEPALMQINPGSTGSGYVAVDAPAGSPVVPVALSAENVPEGWSVTLSGREIDSGKAQAYTVRVPDEAPEGTFTFDVVATAGDILKRETMTVSTVFGLIPECTTTLTGTVSDEEGNLVEDALVQTRIAGSSTRTRDTTTDADGRFSVPGYGSDLPVLPKGYTVAQATLTVTRAATDETVYLPTNVGPVYVRCDETTDAPVVMGTDPILFPEGVAVRTVVGLENPVNPTRPIPTNEPVGESTVVASYKHPKDPRFTTVDDAITDAAGRHTFRNVPITNVRVAGNKTGYWNVYRDIALTAADDGQLVDAGDLPLVPACTGTFTDVNVVDQFGDPVTDARTRLYRSDDFSLTDADGVFAFNRDIFLGKYNRATNGSVEVRSPAEWGNNDLAYGYFRLGACGDVAGPVTVEIERPEPDPVPDYGTLLGTVTDAVTGEPLLGAQVSFTSADAGPYIGGGRNSRTDGTWGPIELKLGEDDPSVVRRVRLTTTLDRYFTDVVEVNLPANTEVEVDIELNPREQVTLSGTVVDADTGEPVEDASIFVSNVDVPGQRTRSAPDGSYLVSDLELGEGDTARQAYIQADFDHVNVYERPYWKAQLYTTLVPGGPNERDIPMVPVCELFSVRGVVVNAATLEPLEDVLIRAGGKTDYSDADGRFEVTDLLVDTNNEPRRVDVIARKSGFFDASAEITGYCGAELVVDFGQPAGGFGEVSGTVTDAGTGDPLADVFVGTGWGDSTRTAADGSYSFDRAPLTSDGEPRDWVVSARTVYDQKSETVTVAADAPATADFVLEGNQPPVAQNQTVTTTPGQPVEIRLGGTDPEGLPLTFTVNDMIDDTPAPASGFLSGFGDDWTYYPRQGFVGTDAFTFVANDGRLDSAPGTVTIVVAEPVNEPPEIAVPTSVTALAGADTIIAVAANDPNDDELSFRLTDDAGGRASIQDAGDGTATITFLGTADDDGQIFDVDVEVSDGTSTDAGTVQVEVVVQQANRAPTAVISQPDVIVEGDTVIFDGSGSSDPDDDPISFAWTLVDFGGGEVASGSGTTWSHAFADDFVGGIRLTVTDDSGQPGMVEEDVQVDNAPPTVSIDTLGPIITAAVGDEDAATVGTPVSLLASFVDLGIDDTHTATIDWGDGLPEPVESTGTSVGASHTYQAPGEVTVVVTVCDDDQGCGADSRVLVVEQRTDEPPDNEPPEADPIATSTEAGTPVDLLLTGDDPEGAVLSFRVTADPSRGTLTGDPPTLRYEPNDGFVGEDEFFYVTNDGFQDSRPARVTITVDPRLNQPPTIEIPETASVVAGESVDLPINADDPDGDETTLRLLEDAGGRATLVESLFGLILRFSGGAHDVGLTFDVTVAVSDGQDRALASVRVTVTEPDPDDDPPPPPTPPTTPAAGDVPTSSPPGSEGEAEVPATEADDDSAPTTAGAAGQTTSSAGAGEGLAATGADLGVVAVLSWVLLTAGVVLVAATRRSIARQ